MFDNLFGPLGSLLDLDGDGHLDASEAALGFCILDDILSDDDEDDCDDFDGDDF